MDFAAFDTAPRAEDGAWLHLRHPVTDAPLYAQPDGTIGADETDKPCRVLARGNQSEAVQAVIRAHERREGVLGMKLLQANDDAKRSALIGQQQDNRKRHHEELARAAVVGWENIIFDGKPLAFSPDAVEKMFAAPAFKVQLFRHCADEERFFGIAPTG